MDDIALPQTHDGVPCGLAQNCLSCSSLSHSLGNSTRGPNSLMVARGAGQYVDETH